MDALVMHGIETLLNGRIKNMPHKKFAKTLNESSYLSFYLTYMWHLTDTLSKYILQDNFYMYVTSLSEVNMGMLLDCG